jgi:hypothetical protein
MLSHSFSGVQAVLKALERHAEAYTAAAAAQRDLLASLASLYPPAGPAAACLTALAGGGPSPLSLPWSEPAVRAHLEGMASLLASPVSGFASLEGRLIESLRARERCGLERGYYLDKVGKLVAEASDKKALKPKLVENQAKLASVMEEHAVLSRTVSLGLQAHDPQAMLVLTPSVLSWLRGEAAVAREVEAAVTTALALVPTEGGRPVMPRPPPAFKAGGLRPGQAAPEPATVPATVPALAAGRSREEPSPAPAPTPAPAPVVAPKFAVARADAPYAAAQDGDLTFSEGDLILLTSADASGWWAGRCGEEFGLVPSNYLALLHAPGCTMPGAEDMGPGGAFEGLASCLPPGGLPACLPLQPLGTAMAAFPFAPGDPTELPLAKGASLDVYFSPAAGGGGWGLARAAGRLGFVPAAYVTPSVPPAGTTTSSHAAPENRVELIASAAASGAAAPSPAPAPAKASPPPAPAPVSRLPEAVAPTAAKPGPAPAQPISVPVTGRAPAPGLLSGIAGFDKSALKKKGPPPSPPRASTTTTSGGGQPAAPHKPLSMMEEMAVKAAARAAKANK